MSDIIISYKGSSIATMDASGTKTLLTDGKYCEDDIEITYVKPGGGGALDFTSEWQRPSSWPAMPNDVTTANIRYFLFKKKIGTTEYHIKKGNASFDIGTTNSSGVFTTLDTFNADTFDIVGLNVDDYFWLRSTTATTSLLPDILLGIDTSTEPIVEVIICNSNAQAYEGTTGAIFNRNTIHLVGYNWTIDYTYTLNNGQYALTHLQCIEFHGGHFKKAISLPINCNKLVIDNVDVTLGDDCIYTNSEGRGSALHEYVNYGTMSLGTRTAFRFNACMAPTSEVQSIITKFGDMSQLKKVENLLEKAHNVTSINFTGAKLTGITSATAMFSQARYLKTVTWGETDLSQITSMNAICNHAKSLQSISFPGTSISITANQGMQYAFRGCLNLTTLDLSNVSFASNVQFGDIFSGDGKLENLTFKQNAGIAQNINVKDSPLLTVASLLSLFDALATVSVARTCTLGATNLAKLTAAEKAIATDKGWTLA